MAGDPQIPHRRIERAVVRHRRRVVRMTGYSGDYIFERVRRTGVFYEVDLLEYMRWVLRHRDRRDTTCVDVGANIGNHSVYFGTFLADQVVSVEPNPAVLPLLERNLEDNLTHYELHRCALGRAEGEGAISSIGTENLGGARVVAGGDGNGVQVRTLDAVVGDRRVALIKADVEGMEPDVLAGAVGTLERDRPEIFVEAATSASLAALRAVLSPLGYRTVSRWASTPVYHFTHRPTLAFRAAIASYLVPHKASHHVQKLLRRR